MGIIVVLLFFAPLLSDDRFHSQSFLCHYFCNGVFNKLAVKNLILWVAEGFYCNGSNIFFCPSRNVGFLASVLDLGRGEFESLASSFMREFWHCLTQILNWASLIQALSHWKEAVPLNLTVTFHQSSVVLLFAELTDIFFPFAFSVVHSVLFGGSNSFWSQLDFLSPHTLVHCLNRRGWPYLNNLEFFCPVRLPEDVVLCYDWFKMAKPTFLWLTAFATKGGVYRFRTDHSILRVHSMCFLVFFF